MHKSYEELCALAATGQITGDAMKVLDEHLKDCRRCRSFLEDLVALKAHVTPVVAGSRTRSFPSPDGIRERFLQRAIASGLELHPGPSMNVPAGLETSSRLRRSGVWESLRNVGDRVRNWSDAAPRLLAPAAVGLLCGILGFVAAQRQSRNAPVQTAMVLGAQPIPLKAEVAAEQLAKLQLETANTQKRLAALSADLTRARADKIKLQLELEHLAERAAAGEQFEEQFKAASAKLQDADARAAGLQVDLEREHNRSNADDAVAIAQQKVTEQAQSTIANLQSQLDRDRELDAGMGIAGDLISARNLHIVDVYDTESDGQRKRAFGRVFFVEGKSLVFYAYDLPDSKWASKKVEFRVWGEQAGLKSVSVNLGAMHNDDAAQKRWVLTCDDPKILNRINAVYITIDPNTRHDSEPRSAKLMYAFLGSPNHP
jgi:hypothetical protein